MKGFMFSIEALFAVAIVILAIGVFAYGAASNEMTSNNTQIQSQAQGQMMLYLNWVESPSSTAKEQYCENITYYDFSTNLLKDKASCWWIK